LGSWTRPKTKRLLGAPLLVALNWLCLACGSGKPQGVSDAPPHGQFQAPDICATPNAGCDCSEPGRVVDCGVLQRKVKGQVWCAVGHRTCESGTWGECQAEGVKVLPATAPGTKEEALGAANACADTPCDPFCQEFVDSGTDLDLPKGLQPTRDGGITLVSTDGTLNNSTCTKIEVLPTPQTITVSAMSGGSPGLLGEYFSQRWGSNEVPKDAVPTATRLDSQVLFDWEGAPIRGVVEEDFTVRWTGFIRPTVTRDYTLCMLGDDGVRVWLGGGATPLINDWNAHSPVENCAGGSVHLVSGTAYPIRIEFFEHQGSATARLRWRHADAPLGEIVPGDALVPPGFELEKPGFTAVPDGLDFTVHGLPDGCFDGDLRAAWAVDRLDRATIDDAGHLSLVAPVSGDITVTAYVGPFSATGVARVNVDVVDGAQAPAGSVDKFEQAPRGSDPITLLYPYAETVFPLALRAPTIQWDGGGTAADAVKVSLRAPASGKSTFAWSKVLPDSDPGRYAVPQRVWSQFEASAKGQNAVYSVQRITGGIVRPEVTRSLTFASAPVRGKIYYTQYARDGSTNMMVADPGSATSAKSVFPSDDGGSGGVRRCPVCHTVSANGTMFATADRSFSANGGLSRINADGTFTLLSDYPKQANPYKVRADDWRGFAWSPLTPDGQYALAADNIWGNSRQSVVGIDTTTSKVSVPGTFLSGGNGTGLLAKYYMNTSLNGWDLRRIDPTIALDYPGSPGGAVPNAFSAEWSGLVQAYTTEPYTFSLETTGGVSLSVGGNVVVNQLANAQPRTFTATVPLTAGTKTPVAIKFVDTAPAGTDAELFLRWSSPATGDVRVIPQTQLYPNDGWHGLEVTYFGADNFTTPVATRIESNVDVDWSHDWSAPAPLPNRADHFSEIWKGQFQAPTTGNLQLCVSADDTVQISVGGQVLLSANTATDGCTANIPVVRDDKYDIEIRHRELTGVAYLHLSWQMSDGSGVIFPREIVPSARLFPPATWQPPAHGVTAAYYDNSDFNVGIGNNQPTLATTRFEDGLDFDWTVNLPASSSAITDGDEWAARFTGRLEAPCSGVFEFEMSADDGARLWIDGERVVDLTDYGTEDGAIWLDAGMHDLKLDYREDFGNAFVSTHWRAACMNTTNFAPIPTQNLYPDGDAGTAGYVLSGGDNGNDTGYFIWRTPTAPNVAPVDVTGTSPGRWGLAQTVMMVPSFSPDGTKLAFVDGDSGKGNGWRKGISTFDFDQANQIFKNRKTIVSTWPFGDVMKWPAFESDSRSLIYQATTPVDACCRNPAWSKYGYMGPTNYFEDPGRLLSVDTSADSPTPVPLTRLNEGERPLDRNKAYQPTMLPQASAGYRWAVFTSTRPYGNTLNLDGQQDFSDPNDYQYISEYGRLQSMLWVSAIDDQPSGASDRSHPAFFLPNQSFSEVADYGYLNERAYWVAEACRPPGNGDASSCDVDEDCCSGSVCRVDVPASIPAVRHCFKVPTAATCGKENAACVSAPDCCKGFICDDGLCVKPPALAGYAPANFERVYASNCAAGRKPNWTFFDYDATVPEGTKLEFYAESADDPAEFHKLAPYPSTIDTEGVAFIGSSADASPLALDAALQSANVVQRKYLKITIRFIPNESGSAAPVLTAWRQLFSCPPGE